MILSHATFEFLDSTTTTKKPLSVHRLDKLMAPNLRTLFLDGIFELRQLKMDSFYVANNKRIIKYDKTKQTETKWIPRESILGLM